VGLKQEIFTFLWK